MLPLSLSTVLYRDGTISSEELAAFDAQDVGQHYDYYHGQYGTDQVSSIIICVTSYQTGFLW